MAEDATKAEDATETEDANEPENVTETGGLREGLSESKHHLRRDLSRDKIEERLNDAVSERPLVRHLLDLHVLARAVAVAAILCAIVALALSPKLGAIVLVIAFFGAWVGFAARQYNERKPTKPIDEDDEEE